MYYFLIDMGGGDPPQVLASWPKLCEDNYFIIFPSFPFSELEFKPSISMETAILWSKYTCRDIVCDKDDCIIRKKKQDNYHPVLLCWQFSNVVFCIPVQGKAVKFDKLTSKKRGKCDYPCNNNQPQWKKKTGQLRY